MVNGEVRLKALERRVDELTRLLLQAGERLAKPLAPQNGWYLGILQGELSQGATATVAIYEWNPDDSEWVDSGKTVIGRDWYLNDGESAAEGTKVKVEYYINTFVITGQYCAPSDNVGTD